MADLAIDELMTLDDCPIGLFMSDDELCLKTKYGNNEGRIDAYIVSTGEFFWGSEPHTIANLRRQMVRPVPDLLARLEAYERGFKGTDERDEYSEAILAAHPTRSKDYSTFQRAERMVHVRHSKYSLVALVNWLLRRAEKAEAALKEATEWRSLETAPKDGTEVRLCDADGNFSAWFVDGDWWFYGQRDADYAADPVSESRRSPPTGWLPVPKGGQSEADVICDLLERAGKRGEAGQ